MCLSCYGKRQEGVIVGAERMKEYIPELKSKKVGLLVNHTSVINSIHLLDTLISQNIQVTKVFAPEHGFRGQISNGEIVKNGIDLKSGIPIISLYGKNKKPSKEQMKNIDILVFDIQDVGTRFYTYISSMHYMMEACADNQIKMIILDRPNPNGHIIDGPVLDMKYKSFVGMHPIPVLHGLTVGELAKMIIGEEWLNSKSKLNLEIVPSKNWTHSTPYTIVIPPSPNLPNDQAISLYPGLCFFEGTKISAGRGTDFPFQIYGAPYPSLGSFEFTPTSKPFAAKYPKFENQKCYGVDLRNASKPNSLDISHLIKAYKAFPDKNIFFNNFIQNLAGTDQLKTQIIDQIPENEIRNSWAKELNQYREMRKKYIIYQD